MCHLFYFIGNMLKTAVLSYDIESHLNKATSLKLLKKITWTYVRGRGFSTGAYFEYNRFEIK